MIQQDQSSGDIGDIYEEDLFSVHQFEQKLNLVLLQKSIFFIIKFFFQLLLKELI